MEGDEEYCVYSEQESCRHTNLDHISKSGAASYTSIESSDPDWEGERGAKELPAMFLHGSNVQVLQLISDEHR